MPDQNLRKPAHLPASTPTSDSDQAAVDCVVAADLAGQTVLAALRNHAAGASWSVCRRWLEGRRVLVNGVVCVTEGRRLQVGDRVLLTAAGKPLPALPSELSLVFVDEYLVVVEKPAGVVTTRRPEESHWSHEKKRLWPTLDELVLARLSEGSRTRSHRRAPRPRLWRVQRLDRDTSGLVVFARTSIAAERLIPQFAAHTVERVYFAMVSGSPVAQTIRTHLVRDRGDGLRGSSTDQSAGELAITHIRTLQAWNALSLIECRLETGRTHQIRIHLAELGHPVCGDDRYRLQRDGTLLPDTSGAPRMALHARHLAFDHPITGQRLAFTSPWPQDLARWRVIEE
jgi:23S rRNA pseudouridine1911/1915/1917 synthase